MATQGWLEVAEVGAAWGLRLLVWMSRLFGRAPAHLVLRLVALYFAATKPGLRRASQAYHRRMGLAADFGSSYRHILRFAQCATDRVFFLSGDLRPFVINRNGSENLEQLRATGRGAILVGAHLGSFEAMRAAGQDEQFKINVVGYFGNARMINAVLERGAGDVGVRLIEAKPGSFEFVFKIRDLIERGEMVAILGDRVMDGDSVEVDFLGGAARFPTGPFALAALLKCPVYFTTGLYYPPNRYELHCEPLFERVELPRRTRKEALHSYVQQYAARLEHYCRQAPDNWFNFFDFWSESHVS